jgi:hypothetical protein
MRNDVPHEALALQVRADRETAQRVPEKAAGREGIFILVDEHAAVVQMRIRTDPGIQKKADHLLLKSAFSFINF